MVTKDSSNRLNCRFFFFWTVIDEIHVIGSRCGPFGSALKMLSKRLIDVSPLITEIFPFGTAREAFERAKDKETLKVLLHFDVY